MRKPVWLLVTGDDFGHSERVNDALVAAHQAGWLTRASIMPGGEAWMHARTVAADCPELAIGLHLTLCDGRALTGWGLAGQGQRLPRDPTRVGWEIWRRRTDPTFREGLAMEIDRQFSVVREAFPGARHWDGHAHLHLHPVIFPTACAAARRHGFDEVRILARPESHSLAAWVLAWLSRQARKRAARSSQRVPGYVLGLAWSGRMDLRRLRRAVQRAAAEPPGSVVEIYSHPGVDPGPFPEAFGWQLREQYRALAWTSGIR